MYRRFLYKIMLLGIIAVMQVACENAQNEAIDNLVYINEASTAKTKDITMQDGTTRTSITVRLAKAATKDIQAELFLDESLLEKYNKKNETNYKMTQAEYVTFPKTVTIKAGDISAEPVDIDVKDFETEGAQFAIPIGIKSVDGGIDKAESSSEFLLVLVKPLKQLVPAFRWYNGMQSAPEGDWGMSLTNYTLEWWCKMSAFSVNNQAVFNSGSGESELYIRFGDLVYADGGRYLYNFLQIKTMGSQFDSGDPTAGKGLEAGKWYHFALTYDAASGTSLLYINGTQAAQLGTSAGKPMVINKLQFVSSGSQYFRDTCEMCQVRLWKTTRTANQIKKSMYSEVEYTNPDLILYYPMNEGVGVTTLHDVTGNGHDVEIGNLNPTIDGHSNVTWESYLFAQ